jgi:hypothetical protein
MCTGLITGYAEIEQIMADALLQNCYRYNYLVFIRIPCTGQ